MAKLGDQSVGSIVKLNVNGTLKNFIVVHHGIPDGENYNETFNGTWLLMEDCCTSSALYSSTGNSIYYGWTSYNVVHPYLNGDFIGLLDSKIQNSIKTVNLYTGGTNAAYEWLSTKIFLLSSDEVVGGLLDYFNGASSSQRIAYLNGSAVFWHLRSGTASAAERINKLGSLVTGADGTSSQGVRPAFVLPFYLEVDDDRNVIADLGETLGEQSIGNTVSLKVNGKAKDFIVVHQGIPSSDYAGYCDGTWLMMKDCYESRVWSSSGSSLFGKSYPDSDIYTYLNDTFSSLLDTNIQEAMQTAILPYMATGVNGSVQTGAAGAPAKIFLPSCAEVGVSGSYTEGSVLNYFDGASSASRVAILNGTATSWWLRTPSSTNNYSYIIQTDGTGSTDSIKNAHGIRPMLILPSNYPLKLLSKGVGQMHIAIGGTLKEVAGGYANIGGVWKELSGAYVNIGGTWKETS